MAPPTGGGRRNLLAALLASTVVAHVVLLGFRGASFVFGGSGQLAPPQAASPAASADPAAPASRRSVAGASFLAAVGAVTAVTPEEQAVAESSVPGMDPKLPEVELPAKISTDPYELLGVDPEDAKQDKKVFYMKRNYRQDTYQVISHMKIAGSLEKGTPNMERYNKRIKEEMDDWYTLYRRQDQVVGRQSYYSLRSAVNALSSHFTSYGPKFPFPNKRRPRLYQKIYLTEKYLEKGK